MNQPVPQSQDYTVWKTAKLSQNFLEGVRGAIPLATEQIEVMIRLIKLTHSHVEHFLDLGCGNGILGKAIYQAFPQAQGYFLDLSETMLQAAQEMLQEQLSQSHFILQDFGQQDWQNCFSQHQKFDVIVSGFSIHYQPDTRKKEIYQDIFTLLNPQGIFLNLEHIASHTELGEKAFDELFIDSLYHFHHAQGSEQSREEINQQYYNRQDKTANILTLVETQCNWLRDMGFVDVDCYFKLFEIALFGGIHP